MGTDPIDEPELLRSIRDAANAPGPLPLLRLAGSLLDATDPRFATPVDDLHGDGAEEPALPALVDGFLDLRTPETSALLSVIAELSADEVLRQRIARELQQRRDVPPSWLRRLTPLHIERAIEMSHVLGDGDEVIVGVTTGADDRLCVVVYIDHNLGTVVKDAFLVDQPIESLTDRLAELSVDEPGTTFRDLDLADARTRVREAIDLGATYWPPLETETWPASRPLVEWVLAYLPEGGTDYERPEWTDEELRGLVEMFVGSEPGREHTDGDARELVYGLFWCAHEQGPGDPLRWSPVSVEILLTDVLPRRVPLPAEVMGQAPEVLRDVIRFAHDERGIDRHLTEETLQAVTSYRDLYLQLVAERET